MSNNFRTDNPQNIGIINLNDNIASKFSNNFLNSFKEKPKPISKVKNTIEKQQQFRFNKKSSSDEFTKFSNQHQNHSSSFEREGGKSINTRTYINQTRPKWISNNHMRFFK